MVLYGSFFARPIHLLCFLFILAASFAQSQQTSATAQKSENPMIIADAHEDTLQRVVDKGEDLGSPMAGRQADIPKWRAGGVNVVCFAAWIDPRKYRGQEAVQRTKLLIEGLNAQVKRHPDALVLCDTAAECRAAASSGKIAAVLGIEGGTAINNDLSLIETYRKLHVRYMTLVWRGSLDWVGSSQPLDGHGTETPKGLNDFGRSVVREMNRVGMVVDLSHSSDQTAQDALQVSTRPVIFSHSNARALAPHPRNITDDMIRSLRTNGGFMGIAFADSFLAPRVQHWGHDWFESSADVATALDHVDYVVKLAGAGAVGFGSDYEGDIDPAHGLETAAQMGALVEGLRKRKYSEENVRKITGGNFLRVLEANEKPLATAKP